MYMYETFMKICVFQEATPFSGGKGVTLSFIPLCVQMGVRNYLQAPAQLKRPHPSQVGRGDTLRLILVCALDPHMWVAFNVATALVLIQSFWFNFH